MIYTDGRPTVAWLDVAERKSEPTIPRTRREAEREMRGALVDLTEALIGFVPETNGGSDARIAAALRNAKIVLALTEPA